MRNQWLLLNVGNTHSKAGCYSPSGACLAQVRFRTEPAATADEYRMMLGQLFEAAAQPELWVRTARAVVASVVPALDDVIGDAAARVGVQALMVSSALEGGFGFGISHPEHAGADRLANIAGAIGLAKPPFLIVDAGTATTFSVVDPSGRYVGGAIAPGLETAGQALIARAAKLGFVELGRPESCLGDATEVQLRSGVVQGHEALIEGMVDRIVAETGYEHCELIATGGCLQHLSLSPRFRRETDLTFQGLYRYGQLNG